MRTRCANLRCVILWLGFLTGCSPGASEPQGLPLALAPRDPPATAPTETRVDDGWAKALETRTFAFPRDHGAHEDYRIEWWYYTGNVRTADGRRFGYQLTFFRTGMLREPTNPSRWTVRDLYVAHFAISDLKNEDHRCFQRSHRRGIDLAGAETERLRVWNGGWRVDGGDGRHRLLAQDERCAIDLTLQDGKPVVLHGQGGLSQKGAAEGNASHYYSLTRMPTTGTITIDDQPFSVEGESWMDHEFSTSFLEPGQAGWDWFAIQLDDGSELMLYQMRRSDGKADPFSSGTFVDAEGQATHLTHEQFDLEPGATWHSPATGATYPIRWRLTIPDLACDVEIRAAFEDQEMVTESTTGISYWEGSVVVSGRARDREVTGQGYLELTGYSGKSLGALFAN